MQLTAPGPARLPDAPRECPDVHVFTTGGTIDKTYFDALSEYRVGAPQIVEILREAGASISYQVDTLFRKDSLDLTDRDREIIRDAVATTPCERVLITHGTDTMADTARALETDPRLDAKCIVLVGSLTPARFKHSDAGFNIGFALGALASGRAGVYVAMNGQLFPADGVRKNRAAGRFEEA
jgi:L-asparaginase